MRTSFLLFFVHISASQLPAQESLPANVNLFGDFRLRFEQTSNRDDPVVPLPDHQDARKREVIRLRAGAMVTVNDLFTVGARLATGSSDDPNTTDVTLGNFVNDLEISLDRLYVEFESKGLLLTGGKFPNPFFRRTDMVWDGDVNPQGLAAKYTYSGHDRVTPSVTGVYAIIDEQTFAPDSYMWGGQVAVSASPMPDFELTLAGGYYDYAIKNLRNADAGDTRSNRLTADSTAYLSDFDLLDATAGLTYQGLGERYGFRLEGEVVKNLGAAGDDGTGFSIDLHVGRASQASDTRFRYGYALMERDAVLAAFSNDNTTLATNYRQHTVAFDWVAAPKTTINATWYLYRRNALETATDTDQWVSRIRLNLSLAL
jgi:hypothetical protein